MPKINPNIHKVVRRRGKYFPIDKLRLHASERDDPFSDELWDYYLSLHNEADMRLYPNNDDALKYLSEYVRIDVKHLNIYDGSDRALRDIFFCFTNGGKVLTTSPSFPMYEVYADMFGAEYVAVPYTSPTSPINELLRKIDNSVDIVILSNPQSPVGDLISETDIMRLHHACVINNVLLVIDEAYIEYAGTASSQYIKSMHSDNCIVVKTLSKGCGSAGARVGYTVSTPFNVSILERVSNMNYITQSSIQWIRTLIKFKDEINKYTMNVITRRYAIETYCELNGIDVVRSRTNFIHVAHDFGEDVLTKQCKLPWSDTLWTRISIPANSSNFDKIYRSLQR